MFILTFSYTFLTLFHLLNAWIWVLFDYKKEKKTLSESIESVNSKDLCFSILIPCFNEEVIIKNIISQYLDSDPNTIEIILIDDGSQDDTFKLMNESLDLTLDIVIKSLNSQKYLVYKSTRYSNFKVIRGIKNVGKAISLNRGIQLASNDLVVTLDADSRLDPKSLDIIKKRFYDPNVIAVGGTVSILQQEYIKNISDWEHLIIQQQLLDYLKGFYISKISLNKQDALFIISGAFGVFRKDALIEVGGLRTSLGEDIDLTVKIQRLAKKNNKKVLFEPNAICYTQSPKNLRDLTKQRLRWQKGFIDTIVFFFTKMMPTIFFDSLSFHMYFESFFLGHISAFFRIVTLVFIIHKQNNKLLIIYLLLYLFVFILRIAYLFSALKISKILNNQKYKNTMTFYIAIFIDIVIFDWYQLIIYLYGTFSYFSSIKNRKWNKVERYE